MASGFELPAVDPWMTIWGMLGADVLASEFERLRPELLTYLTRLVIRPAVAEELVQTAFVRALEASGAVPDRREELRPWIFRIATNLGIDERRRHGHWREDLILDAPHAIHGRPSVMATMRSYQGSPETVAVAREHLVTCFACTLGQLAPEPAAALLLKEVYGFTVEEASELLGARFAQVKNWLQAARAKLEERYAATCALIRKDGVCFQCVQLDGFFGANRGDPLAGTDRTVRARLTVLREMQDTLPGPWSRLLGDVLSEI